MVFRVALHRTLSSTCFDGEGAPGITLWVVPSLPCTTKHRLHSLHHPRSGPPGISLHSHPSVSKPFQSQLSQTLPSSPTPEALDRALQMAAAHLLPAKAAPKGASAADRVEGTVKYMWTLRHTAQQFALDVLRPMTAIAQITHWLRAGERLWFSTSQLLAAWKHQAAYLRQHRLLRRQGRRAKRELLEEQLKLAWEADQQGDKSSLWKVIRKLAPKTARVHVQLRGAQGAILSPQAEAEQLRLHCEKLYHLPRTCSRTGNFLPCTRALRLELLYLLLITPQRRSVWELLRLLTAHLRSRSCRPRLPLSCT